MAKSRWFNYSYFSKSPIVAVLDIGSSKICCLIAELDKYNTISIVGAGFQESKGLVSGVITDMSALEKSIRDCVASAEKMASLRIKKVIIGFSSVNINIENINIEVDLKGAVVSQGDLNKAYNKYGILNMTLKSGDMLIFNTRLVHGSPSNASNDDRMAIVSQVRSSKIKLNKIIFKKETKYRQKVVEKYLLKKISTLKKVNSYSDFRKQK